MSEELEIYPISKASEITGYTEEELLHKAIVQEIHLSTISINWNIRDYSYNPSYNQWDQTPEYYDVSGTCTLALDQLLNLLQVGYCMARYPCSHQDDAPEHHHLNNEIKLTLSDTIILKADIEKISRKIIPSGTSFSPTLLYPPELHNTQIIALLAAYEVHWKPYIENPLAVHRPTTEFLIMWLQDKFMLSITAAKRIDKILRPDTIADKGGRLRKNK